MHRFISQDPIGFASGDFNWYRYVGNSPVNLVDPKGLSKTKGIKYGDDPYYQRFKDTKGNREEINKIIDEIKKLKEKGKIKPKRWVKLKALIKLAKDGRLFSIWDYTGILLEYEIRKMTNCPKNIKLENCFIYCNGGMI